MPYREPIRAIRERPPSPPQRNISQSSTHTASSTSSLEAAPIRPPPIQTRTAATRGDQLPSAEEVQRQEDAIRSYSRERSSREESRSPVTPRPDRYSFGTRRESPKSPRYGYGQSQYHHLAPSHLLPLELRPSASGPDLASLRKEMLRGESAVVEDVDLPPSPSKGSSLAVGMDTLLISSKSRARSSSGQPNGHGAGGPNSTSSAGTTGGSGRGDVRKAVGLQDFTFGEMIGRGSYSTVNIAQLASTGYELVSDFNHTGRARSSKRYEHPLRHKNSGPSTSHSTEEDQICQNRTRRSRPSRTANSN
jgi:3-phosphoinositide dependent protein kinase-1